MKRPLMSVLSMFCIATVWQTFFATSAHAGAYFTQINPPIISDQYVASAINAISDDGSVLTGSAGPSLAGELVSYHSGMGLALGELSAEMRNTSGNAISGDGQVVYGRAYSNTTTKYFRWTAKRGFEDFAYDVTAVNFDGSVVVGNHEGRAYRWTEQAGKQILGDFGADKDGVFSTVSAISRDGTIIVGQAYKAMGQNIISRPFAWTQENGFKEISILQGADVSIEDISSNGHIIIGNYFYEDRRNSEGFIWNLNNNRIILIDKRTSEAGQVHSSIVPKFTNHDGSVVIGYQSNSSPSASGNDFFIWREDIGIKNLIEFLNAEQGLNYNGPPLRYLRAFSKDGSTIYGEGKGVPNGPQDFDPWMIKLGQERYDLELRTNEYSFDLAPGQTIEWQLSPELMRGSYPNNTVISVLLPHHVKVSRVDNSACHIANNQRALQCSLAHINSTLTLSIEALAPGDDHARALLSANGFDENFSGNRIQTRFRVSGTPTSLTIVSPIDYGVYNNKAKVRFDAEAVGFDGEDLTDQVSWYLDGKPLELDHNSEALIEPGFFHIHAIVADSIEQLYHEQLAINVLRKRDITARIWTTGFWFWKKTHLSWQGNKGPVDIHFDPDCSSGPNPVCRPIEIIEENYSTQKISFDFFSRYYRFKICEAGTDLDAEDAEDHCSEFIRSDSI